jgi:hypothetical protein
MTTHRSWALSCCLCQKVIPGRVDVYVVDGEWVRRFPAMTGRIMCKRCAMDTSWGRCDNPSGRFPPGHTTPARGQGVVCDSWSHSTPFTQTAAVMADPRSGIRQGARPYVEFLANRPGLHPAIAAAVRAALGSDR